MPDSYTISRREFQDMVKRVDALWNMQIQHGTGLGISKTRAGVLITKAAVSVGHPKRKAGGELISVAIVETINDEHTSMQVREVGYAKSPPESALVFKGESFEAYSYFGDATLADYKGFEFTGAIPNETTRVFDARKVDGDWVLERPSTSSSSVRFGRIIDIFDAGSKVGRVQPYKINNAGNQVADGAAVTLPYFPGYLGFQFEQHLGFQINVAIVMLSDGNEYIQQTIPWVIDGPTASAESRCQ